MNLDKSLADIFLEEGYVSPAQLEGILATRPDTTEPLGDLLVRLGFLSDKQRLKCLGLQNGVPFVDLANVQIDLQAARLVSKQVAIRLQAIPIEATALSATVAMTSPLDVTAIDELADLLDRDIDPMWAAPDDLRATIGLAFGVEEEFAAIELPARPAPDPTGISLASLIGKALKLGATDIHLEPVLVGVRVRCRLEGVLQEISTVPGRSLLSELKTICGLNAPENRIAQHGICRMKSSQGEVDLRISTYPGVAGERIAIRVLDKSLIRMPLSGLGIPEEVISALHAKLTAG